MSITCYNTCRLDKIVSFSVEMASPDSSSSSWAISNAKLLEEVAANKLRRVKVAREDAKRKRESRDEKQRVKARQQEERDVRREIMVSN
jgi:hypothetical protein